MIDTTTSKHNPAKSAHGQMVLMDQFRYNCLATKVREHAELAGLVAAELFPEAIVRLNMTIGTCCLVLKAIQDDDWAFLADLPIPNLEGEWSDDPTPEQLRLIVGADETEWTIGGDELMQEWEYWAQMEYLTALEDILINYLGDEAGGREAQAVPIRSTRVTTVTENDSVLTNEALSLLLDNSVERPLPVLWTPTPVGASA